MLTTVALALVASVLFATAFVLQQQEAFELPDEASLRIGILLDLARQPMWLGGIAASIAGYVALALAMNGGHITLVEPILVTNILFALPMAAFRQKQRMAARDWIAAAATTGGLGAFLLIARPHGGLNNAPDASWAYVLGAGVIVVGLLALIGRRSRPVPRAVLLALAAGLALGVTDALTKEVTAIMQGSLFAVFGRWQLYALIVAGIGGLLLIQSAFQAGHIAASLPSMLSVELLVASAIGLTLFDEQLRTGGWAPVGEILGVLVLVAGIVGLATSPLVSEAADRRKAANAAEGRDHHADASELGDRHDKREIA